MKGFDNRVLLISLLFFFLTAPSACGEKGGGGDPKECLPPCEEGEECINGECLPITCDPECEEGEECINGECVPITCDPQCEEGEECINGECVVVVCDPPCETGEHCESDECVPNVCDPPCEEGAVCLEHGGADCECFDPPCGVCNDLCVWGTEENGKVCSLWDNLNMTWVDDLQQGEDNLHNQARAYKYWLKTRLMPAGGIMRAWFTDDTFTQVVGYGGTRDSPIWTGTHMAAESLRYMVTGSPDAAAQIDETVRVMDRWWRVSGDQGYLARYAAPASSPPDVLSIFDENDIEDHFNFQFEGDLWHWKGRVSRDQYQGTMLGHSFAYEASEDEELKEIIRRNVVEFIEVLMVFENRQVNFVIDGVPLTTTVELGHCVYSDKETSDGKPEIIIQTSPFHMESHGVLPFWPNPSQFLRQIGLLSWLPDIYLRSQAIQLGAMFSVALQVTEGVPDYAERRAAILQHYEQHVDEWIDLASEWANSNECGSSYHGLNIAFQPAWNWARLEQDPTRSARLRTEVLRDAMWSEVHDHKNIFFAFIYTSQADTADDTSSIIDSHLDQLSLFPEAPNLSHPVDNTGDYPEDPDCPGLSSIAIDVDDRVPSTFMWERNPWKLVDEGAPNFMFSGVDYIVTYWMARYYGYLEDDSPDICLRWRDL